MVCCGNINLLKSVSQDTAKIRYRVIVVPYSRRNDIWNGFDKNSHCSSKHVLIEIHTSR